jgi:CheY-specific phosphatase CheX
MVMSEIKEHVRSGMVGALNQFLEIYGIDASKFEEAPVEAVAIDLIGIIGLVGKIKGNFFVAMNRKTASQIISKMLMTDVDDEAEEIEDVVGEVANVLAGGLKKYLVERGVDMKISVPTLIGGNDIYAVKARKSLQRILMAHQSASAGMILMCDYKLIEDESESSDGNMDAALDPFSALNQLMSESDQNKGSPNE